MSSINSIYKINNMKNRNETKSIHVFYGSSQDRNELERII